MAAPFSSELGKASVKVLGNLRVVLFSIIGLLVVDCVITLHLSFLVASHPAFPTPLENSSIVVA